MAYNNLGRIFLLAGRSKDALSAAQTLRRLSLLYLGVNFLEGMALLQSGDYEAASQSQDGRKGLNRTCYGRF